AQQRRNGHPNLLLLFLYFGKHRTLMQRNAHIKADQHQHGGENKRHAPAPLHKLLVGQQPRKQQKSAVSEEKANRRTQLREGTVKRTLLRRGVFRRQQRCAAPFTTQSQSLTKTRQRQQQRSHHADGFIAGQQTNHHGGNPHGQQRG